LFYNFCHKNLHIFALPSSAVLKPAQAGLVLGLRCLVNKLLQYNPWLFLVFLYSLAESYVRIMEHTNYICNLI
jgi:hypothetical protein